MEMLDIIKPIILGEELASIHKGFDENNMSLESFCKRINEIIIKVDRMSSFSELIYFIMEGTDFSEEESQNYISNLYFESTNQFN